MSKKFRWLLAMLIVAGLMGILYGHKRNGVPVPDGSRPRPNIIYIMTDDLDTEYPAGSWINHYPRMQELMAGQGVTFRNSYVSLSLCCPSRAAFLRGQYAHNTEIFTNQPPGGGFWKFYDLGSESSTVATWLQDAGYKTVLMGKYLNGYTGRRQTYVPAGWDEWYATVRRGAQQFDYSLNENGEIVDYGEAPEDYYQDVIRGKATDFIRRSAQGRQPFFMLMTPHSPHGPSTFAPRHKDEFPDVQAPRGPTFNQEDVSRMPSWVQNRPLLRPNQIRNIDLSYRKRLQSMLAVVETIEDIIQTLRRTGQLDNTYIFFSSDNGFHLGQHRLPRGKNTEFEEDLRVPLIVRGPGIPAGRVLEHMVLNIDLAPTFAELAGAKIPDFVDGRSLAPLLRRDPPPTQRWRQAFLMEHGFAETGDDGRAPQVSDEQDPPDEFDLVGVPDGKPILPPPFRGIHTRNHVYVEYIPTDERELYDLDTDTYQERNIVKEADPRLVNRLSNWLDRLSRCAGAECRALEQTPPR